MFLFEFKVKEAKLLLKTAEPAGLTLTALKSPPKAPKAPLMALNLAEPSMEVFE